MNKSFVNYSHLLHRCYCELCTLYQRYYSNVRGRFRGYFSSLYLGVFGGNFAITSGLGYSNTVLVSKISENFRYVSEWCFDFAWSRKFSFIILIKYDGDVQVHPVKKKFYRLAWQKARYALKTSVSFQPSFFR